MLVYPDFIIGCDAQNVGPHYLHTVENFFVNIQLGIPGRGVSIFLVYTWYLFGIC
jgi:hypothetical protein